MDLIRAYSPFNSKLRDLETLRMKKRREFTDSYYFGEYLSQNSLKIIGNCQIISAHAIVERGLFLLLPDLQRSLDTESPRKHATDPLESCLGPLLSGSCRVPSASMPIIAYPGATFAYVIGLSSTSPYTIGPANWIFSSTLLGIVVNPSSLSISKSMD